MAGRFWRGARHTGVLLVALLFVGATLPEVTKYEPGQDTEIKRLLRAIQKRRLNREDRERAVAGYYEGLLDSGARNTQVTGGGGAARLVALLKGSKPIEKLDKHHRRREDFLRYDYAPNLDRAEFADERLRLVTNSHGMADQEYARSKPDGVHRLALIGDSVSRGYGVPPGRSFEALLERALNDRSRQRRSGRVEILNFSVVGYRITQLLDVCLHRAPPFEPDVYVVALTELSVLKQWSDHIAAVFRSGLDLKYDYIRRLVGQAGLKRTDSNAVIQAKLAAHRLGTIRWALETMREHTRKGGAGFVILLVPSGDDPDVVAEYFDDTRSAIADIGVPVVDLLDAFAGVRDVDAVRVSELDRHPNELGHRLIADALLAHVEGDAALRKLMFGPWVHVRASRARD